MLTITLFECTLMEVNHPLNACVGEQPELTPGSYSSTSDPPKP